MDATNQSANKRPSSADELGRFCDRLNIQAGKNAMSRYLLGFMKNNSSYVRLAGEGEVNSETPCKVRYAKDKDSEAQFLIPQFLSQPARNKTQIERLRSRRKQIRKGIKKEAIELKSAKNRGFLASLLGRMGVKKAVQASERVIKYRYEFDFEPTTKELNEIIRDHSRRLNSYDDVGFRFTGSSETMWLSSILCKTEDVLEVKYSKDGKTLDSQSFYDAIEQQREKYLATVSR